MNLKIITPFKKKKLKYNYKKQINNLLNNKYNYLSVGDLIEIQYIVLEEEKKKIISFKGLIINKKNSNINKTITIRRIISGISIEQIFFLNSLNIILINKIKSFKIRRSKLYYSRKFLNSLLKK